MNSHFSLHVDVLLVRVRVRNRSWVQVSHLQIIRGLGHILAFQFLYHTNFDFTQNTLFIVWVLFLVIS